MIDLLKIYHRMPYPLRVIAASAQGYYLKSWRYGGNQSERLVEEALERDSWSSEKWMNWQEERLAYILDKAARHVPYYMDYWRKRRSKGDRSSWDVLSNWPILTKIDVRQNAQAFLSDEYNPRRLYEEYTSGSTGTPVQLWYSRDALQGWFALFEARWRLWHKVSRKDRWGLLGGKQITPFGQTKPPFWVWNAGLNQLYMSSLHIRPDFLRFYLDAIRKHSLSYLYGYASALYWLAIQANEDGVKIPMKVVLPNAEPLYDWQRKAIEKAFDCSARETYGQAELVSGGGECEHGRLHLWPDAGFTELVDENDQPVKAGEAGRFIGTSLLNDAMPLIRYDTTDMMIMSEQEVRCPCGRNLPLVEKILGRYDDFIVTPDGRQVMLIDIIFSPNMHLLEAQIIQESLDEFTVKVVPMDKWSIDENELICSAIRRRVGDVKVKIEVVSEIERTWAGKFKVMVSKVPQPTPRG